MSYAVWDRVSANQVASFETEEEGRSFVEAEIEIGDEWALFRFGKDATDNELIATWGS